MGASISRRGLAVHSTAVRHMARHIFKRLKVVGFHIESLQLCAMVDSMPQQHTSCLAAAARPRNANGIFWPAGYEPRGLFNVVEFVMNDKEGTGNISLEHALQVDKQQRLAQAAAQYSTLHDVVCHCLRGEHSLPYQPSSC